MAEEELPDSPVRIGPYEVSINRGGQLVIVPVDVSRPINLFVSGKFKKENAEMAVDTSCGVVMRIKHTR